MTKRPATRAKQADKPERQTRQRQAIRDAIAKAHHPVTPKDILDHAQHEIEGLGLATVYRTLKILAETGIIRTVEIPGESPRYEMADKEHHHHFYCRSCGKAFEVEGCPGDFANLTPAKFVLEGHELVLFGKCAACAKKA